MPSRCTALTARSRLSALATQTADSRCGRSSTATFSNVLAVMVLKEIASVLKRQHKPSRTHHLTSSSSTLTSPLQYGNLLQIVLSRSLYLVQAHE
ncbi:hypothetical protein JT06_07240 [Desulfobulbus sp. Tol-SR]|nr:hypothetical protein JT06_07240 [Desulfobulbus sp. Tol-SR]